MFCGKAASGLSVDSVEFAMLPAMFSDFDDEVAKTLDTLFPGAPENWRFILENCLTALVHHYDYLDDTIPWNHPLRGTLIFRDAV